VRAEKIKMPEYEKNKVTICVVNYKTLDLTRLCLKSIRKFTHYPYELMVIDNGSADESLEYLKSLSSIRLIERTDKTNDSSGGYAHAAALDLGLKNCTTEFFMSLHSDTIVHKNNWLKQLMKYFKENPEIVCVGAGKCELTPQWKKYVKKLTDFKTLKRKMLRTPDPLGIYRYYNRTVCSIYRTQVLKNENLSFLMDRDKGLTVGKKLYFELVDKGYKTVELPDRVMKKYIWHLAHATQVTNPDEYNLKNRTVRKTRRLLNKVMNSNEAQAVLKE